MKEMANGWKDINAPSQCRSTQGEIRRMVLVFNRRRTRPFKICRSTHCGRPPEYRSTCRALAPLGLHASGFLRRPASWCYGGGRRVIPIALGVPPCRTYPVVLLDCLKIENLCICIANLKHGRLIKGLSGAVARTNEKGKDAYCTERVRNQARSKR